MPHRSIRRAALALAALSLASGLAACANPVALERADDGIDAACADIVVRLPDSVADLDRRETNAQGTGAWGSPTSVILRCGVEVPGPTTLPCNAVNGVDWVTDDSDAPNYRFVTYGRTPATEVIINGDAVAGSTVLADLSAAVSTIPLDGGCVSYDDATPVPTPTNED